MSEKNEWNLVIENIGGIRGSLELKIKQPISVINAPNATGKSSIVHALQLLCKNTLNLEYMLNEYEKRGKVELKNGEHFSVELLDVPGIGVEIVPERTKLLTADEKAFHVGFFVRDSELVRIVEDYEPERLKGWFRDISDARYYETVISIINTLLGEKRTERDRLEAILKVEVDVKDKEKALASSQRKLAEVEKELAAANKRLEQSGFGELVRNRERLEGEIHVLRDKIWEMEDKRDAEQRKERDLRSSYTSQERKLDGELEDLYKLTEELKVKEKAEIDINRRKKEIQNRLRDLRLSVDRLEKDLDGYQRSLDEMKQIPKKEAEPCILILEPLIDKTRKQRESEIHERRSLRRELDDLSVALERTARLRKSRGDKKREIAHLEQRMTEIRDRLLPQIEEEIEKINSQITDTRADVEEKEAQLTRLIQKISTLEGVSGELKRKIDELSEKKRELEEEVIAKREDLRKILKARDEYERAVVVVERLQGFLSHMQSRYEYMIEGARRELNQALSKNFELMEFVGFDEITVSPEFELVIKRKGKPPTKLHTLSSTERLTIAMTMMFVAKQAYAEDFPFFIIDEVKEPYDTTRFRRIVDYMKGKVPYLVVTSLVPLKEKIGLEAITVRYSLS